MSALVASLLRLVDQDLGACGKYIDAFLGADAGDLNVDGIDKVRRPAVDDLHDRQAAMNTGIDAENFSIVNAPS